jgi:hypothetical protein
VRRNLYCHGYSTDIRYIPELCRASRASLNVDDKIESWLQRVPLSALVASIAGSFSRIGKANKILGAAGAMPEEF